MTEIDPAANDRAALRQIRQDVARLVLAWDPLAIMVKKRRTTEEIARHLDGLARDEWRIPPQPKDFRAMAEKLRRVGSFLDTEG